MGTLETCSTTIVLVRKCMKLAIELIETEVEGTKAFLEYLHQEPDLILHCQEIEAFCSNLLPKEDSAETAADTQILCDDDKKDISDAEKSVEKEEEALQTQEKEI